MRSIVDAPEARVIHMSTGIISQVMRTMKDEAKVHFLHKPYANDFRQCRETIKDARRKELGLGEIENG